jgi:hypothetical protein
VDEAVEDGVGVGWIADHHVPVLDGEQAIPVKPTISANSTARF